MARPLAKMVNWRMKANCMCKWANLCTAVGSEHKGQTDLARPALHPCQLRREDEALTHARAWSTQVAQNNP